MCGRFTLQTSGQELAEVFDLVEVPEVAARYNIAPTAPAHAVRADAGGRRRMTTLRWGLVPRWAKDVRIGARLINARGETAHELPAFRSAFRRRRCLVAADGWYEWRREGARGQKQPYRFVRHGGQPFGMAGLFEEWVSPDGETVESVTILTIAPNAVAAEIHDRMPLILEPDTYEAWLDPALCDITAIRSMIVTPSADGLTCYPVDPRVNNARNDDASLILPAPVQPSLL